MGKTNSKGVFLFGWVFLVGLGIWGTSWDPKTGIKVTITDSTWDSTEVESSLITFLLNRETSGGAAMDTCPSPWEFSDCRKSNNEPVIHSCINKYHHVVLDLPVSYGGAAIVPPIEASSPAPLQCNLRSMSAHLWTLSKLFLSCFPYVQKFHFLILWMFTLSATFLSPK